MLARGAPAMLRVPTEIRGNPVAIARLELESRVLPFLIQRTLPDGSKVTVSVNELQQNSTGSGAG